eukprot:gnl/MRDRNA2_/MRDRNA2_57574_c0_seq1.p1 gnl/MRDRNA2_/MRDRNA2_57574_c0~~gnl/MRDRNA2_/MRDRNA2_57574_c0_seq1.p1  ORF type:complete len:398 (+),score=103.34 gnl/MRDRNA2_/MRDRNA2_57574_c0_seq1:138-1331(+)
MITQEVLVIIFCTFHRFSAGKRTVAFIDEAARRSILNAKDSSKMVKPKESFMEVDERSWKEEEDNPFAPLAEDDEPETAKKGKKQQRRNRRSRVQRRKRKKQHEMLIDKLLEQSNFPEEQWQNSTVRGWMRTYLAQHEWNEDQVLKAIEDADNALLAIADSDKAFPATTKIEKQVSKVRNSFSRLRKWKSILLTGFIAWLLAVSPVDAARLTPRKSQLAQESIYKNLHQYMQKGSKGEAYVRAKIREAQVPLNVNTSIMHENGYEYAPTREDLPEVVNYVKKRLDITKDSYNDLKVKTMREKYNFEPSWWEASVAPYMTPEEYLKTRERTHAAWLDQPAKYLGEDEELMKRRIEEKKRSLEPVDSPFLWTKTNLNPLHLSMEERWKMIQELEEQFPS